MIQRMVRCTVFSLGLVAGLAATADAASVTVATWTANGNTGGGPLTLGGTLGSNTVTLLPRQSPQTQEVAFFEDWTASPATNGFVTTEVPTSGNTSIAIAEGASTTETVSFATAVVNPMLLIDFADPTVTYNFGMLSVKALSLNNASLSSGVLSFPGATDNDVDGAVIQVNGTFTSFSFTASDSGGRTDTQRFTIASASVPEPSSLIKGLIASLFGASLRLRMLRKPRLAV